MSHYPKVTIIIPLYVISERFFLDFLRYERIDYQNFEIIVVSDKKIVLPKLKNIKITIIQTGKRTTGPAEKRDIGINKANGEICAFIDDDAYPDKYWLKNAIKSFQDKKISAIGGPGITPPEDGFWEQITGIIYKSYFCGGPTQHRFTKAKKGYVKDYPAYNLLVRRNILKKIGGYQTHFYGGEDTFLCLKIIKNNDKILYDPEVVVYHHRRPILFPYLKQIANIGKHRGYFAKKFPETSLRLFYFIPSILSFGFLVLVVGSLINKEIFIIFIFMNTLFYLLAFFSVILKTNLIYALFASFGIILTHLVYGFFFIKGLLIRNLER